MAFRHARWILLSAAALSLSGCTSIFHAVFARHGQPILVRAVTPAPAPAIDPLTQAGRAHLAAGNTGLAIEAFQHALGTGEPAAPALNGLGVAYARIDRFETAQKLFEQAIALAPDNQQYAANMARLLRSPALAMRHDGDIAASIAPVIAAAPTQPAQPARGQLVRVSANEFHITTIDPAPVPVAARAGARRTAAISRPQAKLAVQSVKAPAAALAAPAPAPAATEAKAAATTLINPFTASSGTPSAPLMKVESRSSAPSPEGKSGAADL